jgi:hypothetical protein
LKLCQVFLTPWLSNGSNRQRGKWVAQNLAHDEVTPPLPRRSLDAE